MDNYQQWLQNVVNRGDNIRVVSNPTLDTNINDLGNPNGLSFFGEEVQFLENVGYIFDSTTKMFIPN